MKVSVNLQDIYISDLDMTVAEIIKDEIEGTIRRAVKEELKSAGLEVRGRVRQVALQAAQSLTKEKINDLAVRIAKEIGA